MHADRASLLRLQVVVAATGFPAHTLTALRVLVSPSGQGEAGGVEVEERVASLLVAACQAELQSMGAWGWHGCLGGLQLQFGL